MPKVSIITPTYNRANLLPRVWASLCSQIFENFEWIIVDDGSTDNTKNVVAKFENDRIHYISQLNNGVNGARRTGEALARGEYVLFLDSDDELVDKHTLSAMVNELESAPADVGLVGLMTISPDGQKVHAWISADRITMDYQDIVCEKICRGEFLWLYRKEALADTTWPQGQGLECLRLWRIAKKWRFLALRRFGRIYYKEGGDNLTGANFTIKRAGYMAEMLKVLIDEHWKTWQIYCTTQWGHYLFFLAMYQALDGQFIASQSSLFKAIRHKGPVLKCIQLIAANFLPNPLLHRVFLVRASIRG